MSKVDEIVQSIETLSEEEFTRLRDWIADRDWKKWDEQISNDVKSGKLDFLVREAMDEKKEQKLKKL